MDLGNNKTSRPVQSGLFGSNRLRHGRGEALSNRSIENGRGGVQARAASFRVSLGPLGNEYNGRIAMDLRSAHINEK